jgi:uncharacterized protein
MKKYDKKLGNPGLGEKNMEKETQEPICYDENATQRMLGGALRTAARTGNVARLTELLAAGASPRSRDERGNTALILAAKHAETECVKLLLPLANPMDTNEMSQDALMEAAACGSRSEEECAQLVALLLPLSDPMRRDSWGRSALMRATLADNAESVRVLLPLSDPKLRTIVGNSALVLAFEHGSSPEVVEALLPHSNLDDRGHRQLTAESIAQGIADLDLRAQMLALFQRERIQRALAEARGATATSAPEGAEADAAKSRKPKAL